MRGVGVHATVPATPWVLELELACANLLGVISKANLNFSSSFGDEKAGSTEDVLSLLQEAELESCVELSALSGGEYEDGERSLGFPLIQDLLGGVPSKDTRALCAWMQRRVPGRPMLAKRHKLIIESTEFSVLSAILSLCGMGESATALSRMLQEDTLSVQEHAKATYAYVRELTPVWKCAHRVSQWLISRSQSEQHWFHMAQSLREEMNVSDDDDGSQEGDATPTALKELSEMDAPALKLFCELRSVPFDAQDPQRCIDTLQSLMKKSPVTMEHSLESLSLRVQAMALFLTRFRPAQKITPSVCIPFFASTHELMYPGTLRRLVLARTKRSARRASAYDSVARVLTCVTFSAIQQEVVRHLPCRYYIDGMDGCTTAMLGRLQNAFSNFLGALIACLQPRAMPPGAYVESAAPTMLCTYLVQQYCFLPFRASDADSVLASQAFKSLPNVAFALMDMAKQSPMTQRFDSGCCCSLGLTGQTFVKMDVFECITCGLTDGNCCCSVCAQLCHPGHDIAFKRKYRAFCDCGLSGKCKAMSTARVQAGLELQHHIGMYSFTAFQALAETCLKWPEEGKLRPDHALALTPKKLNSAKADPIVNLRCSLLTSSISVTTDFIERQQQESSGEFPTPSFVTERMLERLLRSCYSMQAFFPHVKPETTKCPLVKLVSALSVVISHGSLACQRLAVRLLEVILPIMDPQLIHLTDKGSTRLLPTVDLQIWNSGSGVAFLSGLITRVGYLTLSPHQLYELEAAPSAKSDRTKAPPSSADTILNTSYQTVVHCADGFSDALATRFLDTFKDEILDRAARKDPPADGAKKPKKVDRAWAQDFRQNLDSQRRAVCDFGSEEECTDFGLKIAAANIEVTVEEVQPDECTMRNHELQGMLEDAGHGAFLPSSRQHLIMGQELVNLVRQLLNPSKCPLWAPLVRTVLNRYIPLLHSANLRGLFLADDGLSVSESDSLSSSASPGLEKDEPTLATRRAPRLRQEVCSAAGALMVIAGTGFAVPYAGGHAVFSGNICCQYYANPLNI
jgi:hypothetical protein